MKHYSTKIFYTLVISLMLGLLTACGPRMSTVTDYIPPVTESGMHCVSKANQARGHCEENSRLVLEQCNEKAMVDAEQAFFYAKNQYTKQLEKYIRANEQYEHNYRHYKEQKHLLISAGELEYIRCSDDLKMEKIDQFPKCKKFIKKAKKRAEKLDAPVTPIKPKTPNRNAIFNRFRASCNQGDNYCEQTFNQSYRSCGGTINYRQVCVSNCN